MMFRYRYSIFSAYDVGEKRHPQLVIRDHAPDAFDFHPATIGDCWLFTAEEITPLPSYIEIVEALA